MTDTSINGSTFDNVTTYEHDALGRLTADILPNPDTGDGAGVDETNGPETDYTYDGDGNVLTVLCPPRTATAGP